MKTCTCPNRFFGGKERIYLCNPGCQNWNISQEIARKVASEERKRGALAGRQLEKSLMLTLGLNTSDCRPLTPTSVFGTVVEITID
jgi:hypothetical protein